MKTIPTRTHPLALPGDTVFVVSRTTPTETHDCDRCGGTGTLDCARQTDGLEAGAISCPGNGCRDGKITRDAPTRFYVMTCEVLRTEQEWHNAEWTPAPAQDTPNGWAAVRDVTHAGQSFKVVERVLTRDARDPLFVDGAPAPTTGSEATDGTFRIFGNSFGIGRVFSTGPDAMGEAVRLQDEVTS